MRDFSLDEIKDLVPEARRFPPTGDAWLDGRFQWEAETSNQPKPYYKMFYMLARTLQPEFVVELGSWRGIGAAHFAAGGAGLVVTIDHHSDPGDEENKRWVLETVDRYDNLRYIQGWTWDPQTIERVAELGQPDMVFVDGWHVYDMAAPDWLIYSRLLANRALIICDDIADMESPTISGMQRFWDELPGYPDDPQRWLDGAQAELHRRDVGGTLIWESLPGEPWAGTWDKWLAGTALSHLPMGFMKLERS